MLAAKRMGPRKPIDGPVSAHLIFSFERPSSWPKRRADRWKVARPDIDNLVKSVLDACNGIVYRDDAQVVVLVAEKVIIFDDEPHVRVDFTEIPQ